MVHGKCIIFLLAMSSFCLSAPAPDPLQTLNINLKVGDGANAADIESPFKQLPGYPLQEAVWKAPTLYIAGKIGIKDGKIVRGGFSLEFEQVMNNMESTLRKVCADLSNIMETTVYLTNMDDYATLNKIYSSRFSSPYPARSVVGVRDLALQATVEMKAVAFVEKGCK